MTRTAPEYTDDKGEMDTIGTQPLRDFLPTPDELAAREETVKVTLSLSRESVEFFKQEARRHDLPYQRMIRVLLDEYARQHKP